MFSSEFCEIFKNSIFYRTSPVAASDVPVALETFYRGSRVEVLSKIFYFCFKLQHTIKRPMPEPLYN